MELASGRIVGLQTRTFSMAAPTSWNILHLLIGRPPSLSEDHLDLAFHPGTGIEGGYLEQVVAIPKEKIEMPEVCFIIYCFMVYDFTITGLYCCCKHLRVVLKMGAIQIYKNMNE